MESLAIYLPMDRRQAMLKGEVLPDRTQGTVLMADIRGFVSLTEALVQALGRKRGADELTRQLNRIYEVLIAEVHRYQGSVVGFSGDAITCWFDDDEGPRAAACALAMQQAMESFAGVEASPGTTLDLAIKVAVVAGSVRRFLVGDPQIQYLDVLVGQLLDRLALGNELASRGEVLVGPEIVPVLGYKVVALNWREAAETGERFAVVAGLANQVQPEESPWPPLPASTEMAAGLSEEQLRPWFLSTVYERLKDAEGQFMAELRRVVALFVRFEGLDYEQDEAVGEKLDAYIRWAQGVLARYGGTLLQLTTGDKGTYFYAVFGAPIAHDDDALRALAAATELHASPEAFAFIQSVQIGLSQGRMRTGAYGSPNRRAYGVLGDEVNVASRLMTRAQPGQILVSKHMAEAAARRYYFKYLGVVAVKGKQAPVPIFIMLDRHQPTGQRPGTLFSTPLVGRKQELAWLSQILQKALAGEGQIMRLTGTAGIGKSHLAAESAERAIERGFQVVVGACQSMSQHIPYDPWRQIFRALFGLADETVGGQNLAAVIERQIAQVEVIIRQTNPDWLPHLPLLGDLLGLPIPENSTTAAFDPELRQGILLAIATEMLHVWARAQPMVVLMEDVHWLDEASKELVLALSRTMAKTPMVLTLVQRPYRVDDQVEPLLPDLTRLPYHHCLTLDELSPQGVAALVTNRLQGPISPLALSLIQIQAQGNPFFTEELIDTLREAGHLQRRQDGVLDLSEALFEALQQANCLSRGRGEWQITEQAPLAAADLGLPDSVYGLVLSRLDRLPASHKLTLKVASVIGRSFEIALLAQAHPVHSVQRVLPEQIKSLERQEFIRLELPSPHLTYMFKHQITQEITYETLPYDQRRHLHGLVAQWYEHVFGPAGKETGPNGVESPLAPYAALLAHHWHQAEDRERERYYARLAGHHAAARFANAEAVRYFSRALEMTPGTDYLERYALLLAREQVYDLQGEREAQSRDLAVLKQLANILEDDRRRAEVAVRQANYYNAIGDYRVAVTTAQRAIDLAQASHAAGYLQWGIALSRQGDWSGAQEHLKRALELARAAPLRQLEADSLRNLGVAAMFQGDLAEAQACYEQVMQICGEIGSRWDQGRALGNLAYTLWLQGDMAEAQTNAVQSLQLCRETGDRRGECLALLYAGIVALSQGDEVQARSRGEEALTIAQGISNRWEAGIIFIFLSLLAHNRGDNRAAYTYSRQARQIGQNLGDTFILGYALTTLGHAQVGLGKIDEAMAAYQQALGLRRVFGQMRMAIEALAGLARVALAQGQPQQAQAHVAEILKHLPDRGLEGTFEPFRIYLTCYQVLQANRDPRAQDILQQAHRHLLRRAAQIEAQPLRRQFLEEVKVNRALMDAWDEKGGV
jgi:adenylate cyclase